MSDPSPLTLTNAQLVRLADGLAGLDGIRRKPGEFEPFTITPDATWKIASNASLVADKVAAFERAKKLLGVKYQMADRMPVTAENAQRVSEFLEALALLEDNPVEVAGLELISRAALNVGHDKKLGQNPIAPSALAALIPILEN